jgi:hypothetical protein
MRAALAFTLLLLAAVASPALAEIRATQAEIVIEDARDTGQASLDLDLVDGQRIAFHLACRGDGRTLLCRLTRRDEVVASVSLAPDRVLTGASRQTFCQAAGVRLTLAVSDLIQTQPAPVADSYHFRVTAEPLRDKTTTTCPRTIPIRL